MSESTASADYGLPETLGVRQADCGCCLVVDAVGLRELAAVVERVEMLAESCERKASEDRAKVAAGELTIGEQHDLSRRADNYNLVAVGLRRALAPRILPPDSGASS